MNIFSTSPDPIQSAKWLCDKHVLKQGLEGCQLLAHCFTLERLSRPDCPRTQKNTTRKHFNPKHPSTLFTTHNRSNMQWLIKHTQAIFAEKYRRYPNGGQHFAHDFLDWAVANINDSIVPDGELTDFFPAINSEAICRKTIPNFDSLDTTRQYQFFIIFDKPFAIWPTESDIPPWYPNKDKYTGNTSDFDFSFPLNTTIDTNTPI